MLISIEILIDNGFMHGDAQFNCSTSKKVVKLSGFPTMIDYDLIVNGLILGRESYTYKSHSKSYTPI